MALYTVDAIARVLGLSKQEVKSLTRSGVIEKGYHRERKLYSLDVTAKEIIQELKRPEAKKKHVDYTNERARLMRVKRQNEEYDLLVKQKRLYEKDELVFALSKMLIAFKARLNAIPNRAAPQVAEMSDKAEIMELLSSLVEEALEELSDVNSIFGGEADGSD